MRRPGVCALLTRDNGTGKTLAAEMLARQLRPDLYRIDLSPVAGKYLGETENNQRGVFRFTERGQAIFLFDETGAAK